MSEEIATNPLAERLDDLRRIVRRKRLDAALIFDEANILSLTGVTCDNGCLVVPPAAKSATETCTTAFITDFRYVPMAHRVAPWLETIQLERGVTFAKAAKKITGRVARIGYEGSITAARYLQLVKTFGKETTFVDIRADVLSLRAVKTVEEIMRLAAAEKLNDEIWTLAQKDMRAGMTEKDIQRIIRGYMNALGDGEAFETIVCAGANAAECHHVPDDTVWHAGESLLVDMGVKLNGVCSDMTRCIKPKGKYASKKYNAVYDLVLQANTTAIAAAKPGLTAGALDKVARDLLKKAGYDKAFGHSLGHGVGYEIHELPTARQDDKTVLEPGMLVTIEPGVYLEGELGVRIEDLILITTTGCEVLSHSRK